MHFKVFYNEGIAVYMLCCIKVDAISVFWQLLLKRSE